MPRLTMVIGENARPGFDATASRSVQACLAATRRRQCANIEARQIGRRKMQNERPITLRASLFRFRIARR